ncbi:MAG: FkbM family methyltransferase [Rhodobacteraceae bacterium]|nr:FkbM family methyltransferase [Paracoccaceae bacterium]
MRETFRKYYEVRPFGDAVRYLFAFAAASVLARGIRNRKHRFFQQGVGSIDRHIITEGYFEKGTLEVMRKLITVTGYRNQYLDIGGNIGNHAVALSDLFARVDTFEPHPVLFKVLDANIAVNAISNITPHNFGLGNEDTTVTLVESNVEHGLSKVADRSALQDSVFQFDPTNDRKTFAVKIRNAMDVLGTMPDLTKTFIKIDVEGMEQEILETIEPTIAAHRPIVSFEWFSKEQPGLMDFAERQKDYVFFGIECHDQGSNKFLRALKIILGGRYCSFQPVQRDAPATFYTLAVLVPKEAADGLLARMNEA